MQVLLSGKNGKLCENIHTTSCSVYTVPLILVAGFFKCDKIHTIRAACTLSHSSLLQGYQMLKNGKLYGSIIPADVSSLRIRDVSLGEKLTLQLIALTEHPVGKSELRAGSVAGDKDSGISGSTAQQDDRSAGRSEGKGWSGERGDG